jgi:hypothetical protein
MYEESPWAGRGPGSGAKVAFGLTAGLAVVSAVLGVVSAVDGDVLGVLGFSAGGVFLGHLVGFGVHMWWRPRRSAPTARLIDGAVTFRYSGWTYYWLGSVTVLMVLALLLLGMSALPAEGGAGIVVAVPAFAGAAFLGWHVLRLVVGRRGCLRLTPTMLEHHGLGFTHCLPWNFVTDVRAAEVNEAPLIILTPSLSAPMDVTFTWITRVGGRRGLLLPAMAIRGVWLADDPVTVYRTLLHYHANPEHRVELSTEAATDRIHQGRFLFG